MLSRHNELFSEWQLDTGMVTSAHKGVKANLVDCPGFRGSTDRGSHSPMRSFSQWREQLLESLAGGFSPKVVSSPHS